MLEEDGQYLESYLACMANFINLISELQSRARLLLWITSCIWYINAYNNHSIHFFFVNGHGFLLTIRSLCFHTLHFIWFIWSNHCIFISFTDNEANCPCLHVLFYFKQIYRLISSYLLRRICLQDSCGTPGRLLWLACFGFIFTAMEKIHWSITFYSNTARDWCIAWHDNFVGLFRSCKFLWLVYIIWTLNFDYCWWSELMWSGLCM